MSDQAPIVTCAFCDGTGPSEEYDVTWPELRIICGNCQKARRGRARWRINTRHGNIVRSYYTPTDRQRTENAKRVINSRR